MIYITYTQDEFISGHSVKNVWETIIDDAEDSYKRFIAQNAKDRFHIVINPHWLNIMNYKDYHNLLEIDDYNKKRKEWNKFLKEYSFDKYLEEIVNAKKLEFRSVYV